MTVSDLLAEFAERLEREDFFARAHSQLVRLREDDPQEWARYRDESLAWQRGTDRDALALRDEPGWWE